MIPNSFALKYLSAPCARTPRATHLAVAKSSSGRAWLHRSTEIKRSPANGLGGCQEIPRALGLPYAGDVAERDIQDVDQHTAFALPLQAWRQLGEFGEDAVAAHLPSGSVRVTAAKIVP